MPNSKQITLSLQYIITCLLPLLLSACISYPETIQPVKGFELNRYLGKWYEVARLDHSFERGMNKVTAEYSLRKDGGVKVINKGWHSSKKQWQEAIGKAYFVREVDEAYLKVSFFGPFYGAYVIFEMDKENYQYAFISGPNHEYLWLLSRTPEITDELQEYFLKRSETLGFNTNNIIFVKH
ncbi:MAG: lipocalin family protein [Gammaproteobacteria bacterium]|nr:lipocalin family protein [Gammaproteobacteria bacterium]